MKLRLNCTNCTKCGCAKYDLTQGLGYWGEPNQTAILTQHIIFSNSYEKLKPPPPPLQHPGSLMFQRPRNLPPAICVT